MDNRFGSGIAWSKWSTARLYTLDVEALAGSLGCDAFLLFAKDGSRFNDGGASASTNDEIGVYVISYFSGQREEWKRV
jgi:hypothetical protein